MKLEKPTYDLVEYAYDLISLMDKIRAMREKYRPDFLENCDTKLKEVATELSREISKSINEEVTIDTRENLESAYAELSKVL